MTDVFHALEWIGFPNSFVFHWPSSSYLVFLFLILHTFSESWLSGWTYHHRSKIVLSRLLSLHVWETHLEILPAVSLWLQLSHSFFTKTGLHNSWVQFCNAQCHTVNKKNSLGLSLYFSTFIVYWILQKGLHSYKIEDCKWY